MAAGNLALFGPDAVAAVPALIDMLEVQSTTGAAPWLNDPRRRAVFALGAIGPAAKAAVPALLEAMNGQDQGLARAAAKALRRIDPDAATDAVPTASEGLKGRGFGAGRSGGNK